MDMTLLTSELTALAQVLMIDLVLAGDNAVVVGMAAAGLPHDVRRKAILLGIGAAAVLRILFSIGATQLLSIIGLTLAGGVLLLWVAWKMWREIQSGGHEEDESEAGDAAAGASGPPRKTLRQALVQIVIADVSMSLDNVLAVAGAAREHLWVLILGLAISVLLMGAASTVIARLLGRYRWIAYVGLVLIAYVAIKMIYDGAGEVCGKWDAAHGLCRAVGIAG